MQLQKFISKYQLDGSHLTSKKLFGWWKVVVIGLLMTAAALLFASLILSAESTEKKSSRDTNGKFEISAVYFDQVLNRKNLSKISQRILPMANVYCSIKGCTVTCSLIPAASHPGIIAAVFIDSEYESHCPDEVLVEELVLENCRFPRNSLSSEWFPSKLQLKKLTLRYCSLTVISSNAFSSEQFAGLRSLAIIDNNISVFEKSVFDSLSKLQELVITNNAIHQAEADLLTGTANSLQIIQMDNAISSGDTLINITGKSTLPEVLVLSLTGNVLENISVDFFKGVPNVQSVYLTNSAISSVQATAFDSFSGSIRQLFMAGNKMSSLPRSLFDSILKANANFKLALANNIWHCSCELQWLKNLTNIHQILNDEPRCTTPDWNAGLRFSEAAFCETGISSETDVATSPNEGPDSSVALGTTEPIDLDDQVTPFDKTAITLRCPVDERASGSSTGKFFATQEFEIQTRFPSFSVQEKENGSVLVTVNSGQLPLMLVWFENNDASLNISFEDTDCITNVRESMYLDHLRPGGLYTICLLDMLGGLSSPFNCLSLHKMATYHSRLWLSNEDKPVILCGLTAALILVCLVSVMGSYYVVRKNPRLLKGSKRIIMVHHRAADAIVLPEGLRLESSTKDSHEGPERTETSLSSSTMSQKEYMTPTTSKRRLLVRRVSSTSGSSSRSSADSYVSGIEPTTMQLMSWRIGRIRNNLSFHDRSELDDSPPPLPPPRNKSVPSVSFNVDERELVAKTSSDSTLISTFANADGLQVHFKDSIDERGSRVVTSS